jgi:hypothetical protein
MRAVDAGVANRVGFEVASAQTFSGTGYDLAATFDCLHDTGAVGAARHVRQALADDGSWLIVEPIANAAVRVRAQRNCAKCSSPVGRREASLRAAGP